MECYYLVCRIVSGIHQVLVAQILSGVRIEALMARVITTAQLNDDVFSICFIVVVSFPCAVS